MSSVSSPSSEPFSAAEPEIRSVRAYEIARVAVLGAGTMGARIAAHVANAGLPVLLLDMVPATGERNGLAVQAIARLKSGKPAAFASSAAAALITPGNFEDDLAKLKDCDWVIEAVAENLDIKRSLLANVSEYLHPNAILTTNTSGLPVARVAEQLSAALRQRFFGTHFFNPPRYMRLLEIISTPETDSHAVQAIAGFGDSRLGKEVVAAYDVQNFIANRVGTFSLLITFKVMQQQDLTIEEIDLLTGQTVGWPKSGTCRLSDMVGIDVLTNVAGNFLASAFDERADVALPELLLQLTERKWLGDKTGQGFYKKDRGPDGKEVRLVLDPQTFEYNPPSGISFPAIDRTKSIESLSERLKILLDGDPLTDKAAKFYLQVLPELWIYAANRIGEISENLVDIDRAMTAGFNWELGPFAMWDAAGFELVVATARARNIPIPIAVEKLLAAGGRSWYRNNGSEYFDVASATYRTIKRDEQHRSVVSFKQSNGVFAGNAAISLVDIGEGVGCFEFHSKMNLIAEESAAFLRANLHADSGAVRNFDGFVIGTDAQDFSAGANLVQLLRAAQDGKWDDIVLKVKQFQDMTQAVKFCTRPVVSATAGLCLGGGCEISLHSARRQPHLELYAGLVEAGVGLIPGGGGCKEMLLRAIADAHRVKPDLRGESVEIVETLRDVFETIVMAKVSTSAPEARTMRLIADSDSVTMNRSRLIIDARGQAIRLAREGYSAPIMRHDIPAPGTNVFATLKLGIYLMREGAFISDHDARVATEVAKVLTGGDITPGTLIGEQHLLDLEREAFVSLCGDPKTRERIAFTLKTGKALRN